MLVSFVKIDPQNKNISAMFKYQALDQFLDQYRHLPEQGTQAWKELRRDFIGGSEVASVLHCCKYKTPTRLVLEKLGFNPFTGSAATYWGTVFEEVIRQHCEEAFSCTIRETGSIPYKDGKLSYSPDGLAVVPTLKLQAFPQLAIDRECPTQLMLFEFKCPHSRVATQEIPEHYLPQVSIGMNIIDIMEAAMFVQATYRRCAFGQIGYNTDHNPCGHFKRADISGDPVECGIMIMHAPDDDAFADGLRDTLGDMGVARIDGECFDLGTVDDSSLLEEIMGGCARREISVDYTARITLRPAVFGRGPYIVDLYDTSIRFRIMSALRARMTTLTGVIGVMPYKLLSVHMTPVSKNPTFIQDNQVHAKATRVLQCIEDHRGMDDRAQVMKSVRRYKL